ncbi:peptidylprolyl isomerase [Propionicimonas paludicola]|uniref:peptidylprolyl isomerase n=1 Tax=Propionicimonas paludicola TaxID=185243 RepID=A0A2A9CSB7_9ACTN|nr:peptidylprolyl isomerase [Propionicimonas paludicola]
MVGYPQRVQLRHLIPAAVAVLSLTACGGPASTPTPVPATPSTTPSASTSATPTASATPTPTVPVSDSLKAIKVTGAPLSQPKVDFKAPFAIDKTRVEVLKAGTGLKASANGFVTVHYYGVDGRTGKLFDESYSRKSPITFPLDQVIAGFKLGLTDQREGSRVLIAMPGKDGYDATGGRADAGIAVGDTLIFVVDVISVSVNQPSGKVVPAPSGAPSVTGGAADKPVVTIPSGAAPSAMLAANLIDGTGATVAKDDVIRVRYVGYSWKTGKLIDDQFATPSDGKLSSTIPGWQSGLVGKKVGSRVLLVLPPNSGYPQGSNNPPVEAGDTVVYVVDLLFAYAQPKA